MRRTRSLLFAAAILTTPFPVAAQVTVDPNALNALGAPPLPEPPPAGPAAATPRHRSDRLRPHKTTAANKPATSTKAPAVATAAPTPANRPDLEHPTTFGPSFTSLPPLPSVAPPLPKPAPTLPAQAPKKPASKPAEATPPAQTVAPAAPSSSPQPNRQTASTPAVAPPAAPAPVVVPPQLQLPGAVPPPPSAAATKLAETPPVPPSAAASRAPQPTRSSPAPDSLPPGADRLTLPFLVAESTLPPAEAAMLRDFAQRYGPTAQYTIRAFASPPAGDDDPSTPRRIALSRAESVEAALLASGVQADKIRLLALGNAGGTPPNRVEVIAMPPASGHTASPSSP